MTAKALGQFSLDFVWRENTKEQTCFPMGYQMTDGEMFVLVVANSGQVLGPATIGE